MRRLLIIMSMMPYIIISFIILDSVFNMNINSNISSSIFIQVDFVQVIRSAI